MRDRPGCEGRAGAVGLVDVALTDTELLRESAGFNDFTWIQSSVAGCDRRGTAPGLRLNSKRYIMDIGVGMKSKTNSTSVMTATTFLPVDRSPASVGG